MLSIIAQRAWPDPRDCAAKAIFHLVCGPVCEGEEDDFAWEQAAPSFEVDSLRCWCCDHPPSCAGRPGWLGKEPGCPLIRGEIVLNDSVDDCARLAGASTCVDDDVRIEVKGQALGRV